MRSSRLHVDIETFSEADLESVGAYVYANHPSTELLCACWAIDDGPIKTIRYGESIAPLVRDLKKVRVVAAHNASFERILLTTLFTQIAKLELTWVCTAAKAAMHALPRKLEKAAEELATVEQKDMEGHRVMLKLSSPKKPTKKDPLTRYLPATHPAEFDRLYSYCGQDVKTERAIDDELPDLPQLEREIYWLDQIINDRGIRCDRDLVNLVLQAWDQHLKVINVKCQKLCGLNATQVGELTKYLGLTELTKASIEEALSREDLPKKHRRILELRQEANKTSVRKFAAMKAAMGSADHRLRGMFLYFASITGRWGGRIVQLHNLPRNTAKDFDEVVEKIESGEISGDLAQQLIRPSLIAAKNRELLVGDFSGIEYRITMWLVNCLRALEVIRSGKDLYVVTAMAIYKVSYEKVDDDKRFTGKQAVLGLGFGMGIDRFIGQCASYGVEMEYELASRTVKVYRETYKEVVDGWYELERAAINAMQGKMDGRYHTAFNGRIRYFRRGKFLYCRLPSGRFIAYPFPKLIDDETPWGSPIKKLTYIGMDNITRQRGRISTYGGKLFENVVQGIARDLLALAMLRSEKKGIPVVAHVHDEIVAEIFHKQFTVGEFEDTMTEVPDWADGLPVGVKAFSTQRYTKR